MITGIMLTSDASTTITFTVSQFLSFVAVGGAIITIFGGICAVYRWYLKQNQQSAEIEELKKEQQLLTYGMLACLEGLKQLNCNGAVTDARDKISKYLNEQAHK